MRLFIFFTFIVFAKLSLAQNEELFLRSDNTSRIEGVINDLKNNHQSHLDEYKNEPRLVRLTQSYFINYSLLTDFELVNSGNVLFNKELDAFFEKMVAEINATNNLQKFNVYVLNTTQINAFATDNGSIFFTMGLLARLNTEAEVAAVLCHEIAHFQLKHNTKGFTRKIKSHLELEPFGQENENKFEQVEYHNYSQELELEADSLGFKYLANAGYNPSVFIDVFDVLSNSGLPQKPDNFNFTIPATEIDIRTNFDSVAIEAFNSDSIKSFESATHPSLNAREDLNKVLINSKGNISNGTYEKVLSTGEFKNLVEKVNYTLAETFLLEKNAIEGFCHHLLLTEKYESDAFIGKCLALSFLQISQTEYPEDAYKYSDYKILSIYTDKVEITTRAIINYVFVSALLEKHTESMELLRLKQMTLKNLFDLEVRSYSDFEELVVKFKDNKVLISAIKKVDKNDFESGLLGLVKEISKPNEEKINFRDGVLIINPMAYSFNAAKASVIDAKKAMLYSESIAEHGAYIFNKTDLDGRVIALSNNNEDLLNHYDDFKYLKSQLLNKTSRFPESEIISFKNTNYYNTPFYLETLSNRFNERYCLFVSGIVYTELEYTNRFLSWSYGAVLSSVIPQGMIKTLFGPVLNDSQCMVSLKLFDIETGEMVDKTQEVIIRTTSNAGAINATFQKALYNLIEDND